MKMISAVVRTSCLEGIVKSLEDAGVRGMTISEVKGIGEQVQLFNPYTIHSRIELLVPDEKAEDAAEIILKSAHTGLAGDGVIAVYPAECVIRIRTREKLC